MKISTIEKSYFVKGKQFSKNFIKAETKFFPEKHINISVYFMPDLDLNKLKIGVIEEYMIPYFKPTLIYTIHGSWNRVNWILGHIHIEDVLESTTIIPKTEIKNRIKEIIKETQIIIQTKDNLKNISKLELSI